MKKSYIKVIFLLLIPMAVLRIVVICVVGCIGIRYALGSLFFSDRADTREYETWNYDDVDFDALDRSIAGDDDDEATEATPSTSPTDYPQEAGENGDRGGPFM